MRARGFSLVEVVVALGIFAFCIVVILGLMVTGLRAARGVADETVAVNLAESIVGAWQAQNSKSNMLTIPGIVTNVPPPNQSATQVFYFGDEGAQVAGSAEATLLMSYATRPAPDGQSSLVAFEFRWPANAPTNTAQIRQIFGVVDL